jgi:hypothetical protein
MKIIYLFILLIILCLLLFSLNRKSVVIAEHFSSGMSATFTVQAGDEFQCFYNGSNVSSGSQSTNSFTIDNVTSGSKIYFGVTNNGGPGGLRVQFTYGGNTYYGDLSNIICLGKQPTANGQIIGDAYMGCYADNGYRDLPLYAGWMSKDQCMMTAVNQNMPYYGLQYGGQCFLGSSYGRYGSSGNCNMNCYTNGNEYCGGVWANQIYSINQTAQATIVSPISNNPDFDNRAKTLWVNTGDIYAQGRWLFELTMPSTDKLDFCPNPDYAEFNPAGCLNARTTANCASSALPNYNVSVQKCSRLYNKEDPDKFFMVMNKVFQFVYNIDSKDTTNTKTINTVATITTNKSIKNDCSSDVLNDSAKVKTQIKMTNKEFMNVLGVKSLPGPRDGYSSGGAYLSEFLQSNFKMLNLLKIIGDKMKYPMDPKQLVNNQMVLPDSPMFYALVKESLLYTKNHQDQLSEIFKECYNKTYLLARIIINTPTIAKECNCLGLSLVGAQQCVPC